MGRIEKEKILLIEELNKKLLNEQNTNTDNIVCTDSYCKGTYNGPEEGPNKEDLGHKFSNRMSDAVGDHLKKLYNARNYSKVDMDNISMTTKGMGSGKNFVTVEITIPFVKVNNPCDAYTSFDHVGGWGHDPQLGERKNELKSGLLPGDNLNISPLKRTKEGLQEYWIQWRNKSLQANCEGVAIGSNNASTNAPIKSKTITGNNLDDFTNKVRTETLNKNIDLNSVKINMDGLTLTYNENPSSNKILRLTLAFNLPNEKNCPSCENVVKNNREYGATSIKSGTFENGTRMFSLIVLYAK